MTKDAEEAAKEVAAANEASAAAEKKEEALKKKYDGIVASMASESADAKKQAIKDLAKYNTEMTKINATIAAEKEAAKKIAEHMQNEARDLATKKRDIEAEFKSKTAGLKAEFTKDKAALDEEEKEAQEKFGAEFKTNKQKFKAEMAAVREEKKENKEAATAEQAKIDAKYAEKQKAADAANVAWEAKAHAEEMAENATRKEFILKWKKQAAKDELEYKQDMAEATKKQAEANNAKKKWSAAMKSSEEEQAKQDAAFKKEQEADAEIQSCATDGSQCQNDDGSCSTVNATTGPYMADDLVSCTDTKPEDQSMAGGNWAGVEDPLPKKDLPKPSDKCIELRNAALNTTFGFAFAQKDECPGVAIACHNTTDYKAKHKAFLDFFDMAVECPPYCIPGTQTTDGLVEDTNGICITGADMMMFKKQIQDLPVYKALGTNGRFPAGPPGDLCRMAKEFVAGFSAGSAPPPPPPTAPPTAPPTEAEDVTAATGEVDPHAYEKYDYPNATAESQALKTAINNSLV